MRIDKKLNLVVPIEREDGSILYVHSTPLRHEVFEKYCLIIGQTFSAIYTGGLNISSGPRLAAMLLKQIAVAGELWDGDEGVERGLVAEIIRVSNVLVLTADRGWATVPMYDAIKQELLSEDELSEAQGAITFFIVASAMHTRQQLGSVLSSFTRLWSLLTTPLTVTEYASSLKTSTETATLVGKLDRSSTPS